MINVEKMRFDLFLRSDEDEKTMEKVSLHILVLPNFFHCFFILIRP